MLPFCGRCSHHICLGATAFLERYQDAEAIRKIFLPLDTDESSPRIKVVWCSGANSAVQYVEAFVNENVDAVRERRDAIVSGDAKDPFLLILSFSRDITSFLGDPGNDLYQLVSDWRLEETGAGNDFYRVMTYYRHQRFPEDNFTLRKVLHYEGVPDSTVHEVIVQALNLNLVLSAIEHEANEAAREKCREVGAVLEADDPPERKAHNLAGLVQVDDVERLRLDLEAELPADESEDDEEAPTPGRVSPIELTTMIGAKGLSADHVMILGFDPINMGRATPQLFFVGMTRARISLHLLTAHRARGAVEPHEFVHGIPEEHCEHVKYLVGGPQAFIGGRKEYLAYIDRLPRF